MKQILTVVFLFAFAILSAQTKTDSLTFTGVVFDRETLNHLDEAVYAKNGDTYSLSNLGRFNITAAVGDTIIFSHLGYKNLIVILNDSLANQEYLLGVYLTNESRLLSEVVIVPRYYSIQTLVATNPERQAKDLMHAKKNLRLSAYQGLQPVQKMDNEMNQKMALKNHAMDVEYKRMIRTDQMVGVNFVTVVPETRDFFDGLREKGLALDLGKVTSKEEEEYLRSIFKALQKEKKSK